jgi:predicted site-specific integrase-resolvase
MNNVDFLNDEAAAKILGVSPITVKRWRLAGLLSYVRIGPRRIGITEDHIKDFIARGERPAVGEAA